MRPLNLAAALVLVLVSACGGGGLGAGGPLKVTFPEKHLVTIPMEDQEIILPAKQDADRAALEQGRAESQRDSAKSKLDVAKNDEKEAKIGLSSAKSLKKAAGNGVDRNQQNDAARGERVADLRLRMAKAKKAFFEAKAKWLDKLAKYAKANAFAKAARYELEKAKIASARNIRPSGFKLVEFDMQWQERNRRAEDLRHGVDDARLEAEAKRGDWVAKETEYRRTMGQAGAPESTAEAIAPEVPAGSVEPAPSTR